MSPRDDLANKLYNGGKKYWVCWKVTFEVGKLLVRDTIS
jgi:hypothetical protein